MELSKKALVIIIICCLFGGAGIFWGVEKATHLAGVGTVSVSQKEFDEMKQISDKYAKAEELWNAVKSKYYEEVSDEDLMNGMLNGIFEGTGDPYSRYMTQDEYSSWMTQLSGEFDGIGITFGYNDSGQLEIMTVNKGDPAEKAGLKVGDIILEIDGEVYDNTEEAATHIRGEAGTDVKLKYSRDGKEKEITITRAHIISQTVSYDILDGNIGYIKITSFESSTADDFNEAMDYMESNKVKGFILDLRANGGGLVFSAMEVAERIMTGTVFYTVDHDGNKEPSSVDDECTDIPYVILVDGGTASASEIITAAAKDKGTAKIVGTKTYGKGIIQNTSKLKDGDAYTLTEYQYFSPDNNAIHKIGITPDYVIEDEKAQMNKAIELLQ